MPLGRLAAAALERVARPGRPRRAGTRPLGPARRCRGGVPQPRGGRLSRQGAWQIVRAPRRAGRARRPAEPARPAPLLRDPHARPRGGHPRRAGAARPRLASARRRCTRWCRPSGLWAAYEAAHPRAATTSTALTWLAMTDEPVLADRARARAPRDPAGPAARRNLGRAAHRDHGSVDVRRELRRSVPRSRRSRARSRTLAASLRRPARRRASSALDKLDEATPTAGVRPVRATDRGRLGSKPCRRPGTASAPRLTLRWPALGHLDGRFFGSLRPGGPGAERRCAGPGQLSPGEVELWRSMAGPTAATRSGSPVGSRSPSATRRPGRCWPPPCSTTSARWRAAWGPSGG